MQLTVKYEGNYRLNEMRIATVELPEGGSVTFNPDNGAVVLLGPRPESTGGITPSGPVVAAFMSVVNFYTDAVTISEEVIPGPKDDAKAVEIPKTDPVTAMQAIFSPELTKDPGPDAAMDSGAAG